MAVPRQRKVTVGVTFKGPWFEHNPTQIFGENITRLLKETAEFGQRDVQARIAAIPPGGVRTGYTRSRYLGRVKSLTGKPWHHWAVVSPSTTGMNAKQAISLMAAASSIEGRFHPVRRALADQRRFKRELQTKALKGLT